MPKPLTISPAPFKPSNLSIPPSPFSPRLPLTPPATPPRTNAVVANSNKRALSSPSKPPPSPALTWVWQCHICHRTYPLGTTRRCLDDGHYFCSGVTTVKSWRSGGNPRRKKKKTKKHRACASEFDYAGWKAFGQWRRNEEAIRSVSFTDSVDSRDAASNDFVPSPHPAPRTPPRGRRDCWNRCDFPSECRWGSQHGTQACAAPILPPSPEEHPPSHPDPPAPELQQPRRSAAAAALDTTPATLSRGSAHAPPTTFDGILDRDQEGELSPLSPKELRDRFWDGILDSARQRKKPKDGMVHSPLALHPVGVEEPEPEPESPGLAAPEPAAFEEGGRGSRSGRAGVSEKLFEALDRWTLPGLGGGGEEAEQAPEPVVVAEAAAASSSSAAGHGFDFGFAEEGGWDAGVRRAESDEGSEVKERRGKGKLRKKW